MAQQELDAPQIHPGFEEMRRETVPKYVRVDGLRQVRGLPRVSADVIHGACRYGACPGMAGKEPGARFLLLPILPEQRQEFRGQHDVPIVLAFALPHPQDHARAVDIRDLQLAQFRHSQPRRIERGEDGPMFQGAWGGQ